MCNGSETAVILICYHYETILLIFDTIFVHLYLPDQLIGKCPELWGILMS